MGSLKQGNHDYQFKLLVIGDMSVGKTAMVIKYTDNTFIEQTMSTIGIDHKFKVVTLDGTRYRLQIWDTAGQERYRAITPSYFRDVSGVILVYSVTDKKSFESIKSWNDMIKNNAPEKVVTTLVGSKIDLERLVQKEHAQEEAKKYNFEYFEVSSKTGDGVNQPFEYLLKKLVEQKIKSGEMEKKDRVDPNDSKGSQQCSC